ncbi:unnamed protein product [Symbiodinium necroappetens]|uniref:JmjC domain-containing protein n=1 Tax=Symbiodinium necroappetens TaxID=1628268 RepID=A0A813CFL3_9DINO|nr:unnamed protein product [Symbiodinium necroappetens]
MGKIDVDKMDLVKYPGWVDVQWSYADLHPGDCLYIPFQWYHQVTAQKGRSINVHVWYWRPAAFNATSCDKEQAVTTFADCSWGYEPNGATRHGIIWQLLGRMTLMTAITDPCDILQPTGSGASGQSEERMEEADEVQEGRPCSCRFMRHAAIASFIFAIFLWKVKKSDEL